MVSGILDNIGSGNDYLNQCWHTGTVKWTLRNKFWWNLNWNTNIFFKIMHLKMSSTKFCWGHTAVSEMHSANLDQPPRLYPKWCKWQYPSNQKGWRGKKLWNKFPNKLQSGARFNVDNSFPNPLTHKIHPIVRLLGWGMECILWVQTNHDLYSASVTDSLQRCRQYHIILDCIITRSTVVWMSKHTRTTRTPVFWGYPPPPHDYPYHWVILDPKSKDDKVKVTNFKNSPKFQILKRALHATHLLKLLDKMCKYEMDPMSIVEDTERTRFCPQTDRRTDGQTDKVIPVYPPINFVEAGGIKIGETPQLNNCSYIVLWQSARKQKSEQNQSTSKGARDTREWKILYRRRKNTHCVFCSIPLWMTMKRKKWKKNN